MQKKILVPFLILLCFHCAGQVKFLEGTIILADGKLSTGFIEYRDWTKNPSRINFRETKTGTTVSYAATEITQFEIPNVCKYRSAQVDIDPNPVTTEAITGVRMPSAKGTFLLKVLVEGEKVTLYEFVDSKPHFFISYEKEPVTELVYALVMDPASGNVFTVNDFRGQIKNIPGITLSEKQLQRIENLRYTSKDLTKFTRELNGENMAYSSPDRKGKKFVLFAGVGISSHKLDFAGFSRPLNSLKSNKTFGYSITGGVDLLGESDFQRLLFRAELTLSAVTYKGEGVSQPFNAGPLEYNDYLLEQKNITPSISIIYQFLTLGKARVYGGFYLENNISIYGKNRLATLSTIDNETTVYEDFPEGATSWLAYGWKAGTIINGMIEAGISGKIDGAMFDHPNIGENSEKLALWVTWRFKKKK